MQREMTGYKNKILKLSRRSFWIFVVFVSAFPSYQGHSDSFVPQEQVDRMLAENMVELKQTCLRKTEEAKGERFYEVISGLYLASKSKEEYVVSSNKESNVELSLVFLSKEKEVTVLAKYPLLRQKEMDQLIGRVITYGFRYPDTAKDKFNLGMCAYKNAGGVYIGALDTIYPAK